MKAEYVAIATYVGMALAVSALIVFCGGVALQVGGRMRKEPAAYIFLAIVVAIMAAPIATGRVLSAGFSLREASVDDIVQSFWFTRLVTLIVLGLCAERVLRFIVRREWNAGFYGWGLFWAFLAYAVANQVLNAIFGARPGFDHRAIYALFGFFAIFLVVQHQAEHCWRWIRDALLVFLGASAATALAMPDRVIEHGYAGFLPGLDFRYYGLATHANTIGPLAVTFLICVWHMPYRSRALKALGWLLGLGSLLLTQSKTSIAIAVVIGFFLAAYRYRLRVAGTTAGGRATFSLVVLGMVSIGIAVIGCAALLAADTIGTMLRKTQLWDSTGVYSLTGRTGIWRVAWQEFLNHPLFGYGPTIWDAFYRMRVGMPFANHAHNQVLQSLSEAGIVGAIGLATYAIALIVYALKARVRTEGVSIALVIFILTRSITEVPLNITGIVNSEMLIQLAALTACVGLARARAAAADAARAERPGAARRAMRPDSRRTPAAAR